MTPEEIEVFEKMRIVIIQKYGRDVRGKERDYESVALKMAYTNLIMQLSKGATLKEMAKLIGRHHANIIHYRDNTIPGVELNPTNDLSIYYKEWTKILLRIHPILKQQQGMTLPCNHYVNQK